MCISDKTWRLTVFDKTPAFGRTPPLLHAAYLERQIRTCGRWNGLFLCKDQRPAFASLKLSGKTVAVFGVGDSQGYSDEFCNGMAKLFNELKNTGANLVGEISADGYSFDESEALNNNGNFVGLALDCDNEEEMNEQRVDNWIKIIKPLFS